MKTAQNCFNSLQRKCLNHQRKAKNNRFVEAGRELLYTSASFSGRRISPCEQIAILSVSEQNPPALLPPKSVRQPLSARTADGATSPFPASAGSKGITHYTFQGKSCANRDAARPYWKPRAKGCGAPVETSTQCKRFEAPTEPTGETAPLRIPLVNISLPSSLYRGAISSYSKIGTTCWFSLPSFFTLNKAVPAKYFV